MSRKVDISDVGPRGGVLRPYILPEEKGAVGEPAPGVAQVLSGTDVENSRLYVARYGADLRHAPGIGFLAWDGRRWAPDVANMAERHAKELVRSWAAEAAKADHDRRDEARRRARRAGSLRATRAMTELAKSDPRIHVTEGDLDADPYLLNLENGTLHLKTLQLRPHDRNDLISKLAPTRYDPAAEAPTWRAFIDWLTGGDESFESFLARAAFLSCTGLQLEHVFLFVLGPGANGKSVFLGALHDVLGDYAVQADPRTFLAEHMAGDGPTPSLARLRGARLVSANETERGATLAEAKLKELTGGGRIVARAPFGRHAFEYQPQLTLWMTSNHAPSFRGADQGLWRRLLVVPFVRVVGRDQQDVRLPAKLAAERAGILRWIIDRGADVLVNGLRPPAVVQAATARFQGQLDDIGSFLSARTESVESARAPARQLYDAYGDWARAAGVPSRAEREFSELLAARGLRKVKSGNMVWLGLRLREDDTAREAREGDE